MMREAAYNMLLREGFEYNNYIDIFDGGPLVTAKTGNLKAVRDSEFLTVKTIDQLPEEKNQQDGYDDMMIAHGKTDDFRCIRAATVRDDKEIALTPDQQLALDVDEGASVRVTSWAI